MHPWPRTFSTILCKLMLAFLLVALGDWMYYQRHLHGGHFGFYALALIAMMVASRPAVRRDRRSWVAIAAALLFAVALVYDTSLLSWSLCWMAATIAALLPGTARIGDGWHWFQRLLWQALRGPFAPLLDLLRLLKIRRARRRSSRSLRSLLPVFALPMAGSAVILILFSAANPVIEQMLAAVALPDLSIFGVLRAMLWGVLFVTAWGLLRPHLSPYLLPTFDGRGDINLPGVSVGSVTLSLIAFNLLFALQNLLDVAYLWGMVPMPGGITMADYAHRGAYPLIVTALLAALFVLVTLRPASTTAQVPGIRRLVLLWIAQNIFLVGSSILRTIDYIQAYSLTELRIAALAWMALVAFGLTSICWRLLRDHSAGWLINVNLAMTALILAVVSFVDLGATAARWNVTHAKEAGGKGVALDLCYLNRLGSGSLLALIELEQRRDLRPAFRDRVVAVRQLRYDALEQDQQKGGWTFLGQRRLDQARQMLSHRGHFKTQPGDRDCAGSGLPPPPVIASPAAPAGTSAKASVSLTPPAPNSRTARALTGEIRK